MSVNLKRHSPRLIGGKELKIRVKMATPLPRVARNVKVIYQFLTNQGLYQKHQVQNTKVYHGNYVEGIATVSKPEHIPDEKANGMSLRIGLEYQTIDGGAYHPFWAEDTMVFYVNQEASKFTIEKISSSKGEKYIMRKEKRISMKSKLIVSLSRLS